MFKVLAVVVFTATIDAAIVEYSDDAVKIFSTADPGANATNAKLINSDGGLKVVMRDEPADRGVYLYPDALQDSTPQSGHICGNTLGIQIDEVGTFCNASYFAVVIDSYEVSSEEEESDPDEEDSEFNEEEEENGLLEGSEEEMEEKSIDEEDNFSILDEQALQFLILFKSDTTKPCLVEIPAFKIPAKYKSADQDEIKKWATKNEVGLLSSADVEKFTAISKGDVSTFDLKWLNDLLAYGVFKGKYAYEDTATKTDVASYALRPVALSEDDVHKFTNFIDKYALKEDNTDVLSAPSSELLI